MVNLHDHARALVGRGFRVLPLFPLLEGGACGCGRNRCQGAGKHPRLDRWTERATRDPALIDQWWGRGPNCGIAIATGQGSGAWVLDIDIKDDGFASLAKLEREHGPLPPTLSAITGGGGQHFYFQIPDGASIRNKTGMRPGIDVRGDGGCVVAPPSAHYSGGRYEWEANEDDIDEPQPAPDWLIAMVTTPAGRADRPMADEKIGQGDRNDALMRLGCSMRANGWGQAAIAAALMEQNNAQCSPPLDRPEVEAIAASVAGYEAGKPDRSAAKVVAQAKVGKWSRKRPPFERASEVVIGRELLAEMEHNAGAAPVFSEGRMWAYNPKAGNWDTVEDKALARLVQSYEGRPYVYAYTDEGEAKTKPLGLSNTKVKGAIACAAAEVNDPEFFDQAVRGLCCSNGFLKIAPSGATLVDHAPEHRARVQVGYDYDPSAKAERWIQFLLEVFEGPDCEARAGLLQAFAGAILTGTGTLYQRALVLHGGGANGKSQATEVLAALVPSAARSAVPPQRFGRDYDVAGLRGIMLNACGEIPDGDIAGSDRFKGVISGEPIQARVPFSPVFCFRPFACHLFSCNTLPGSADTSRGYWRRFMVLRFDHSFEGARAERGLAQRIIDTEIAGVARWAVEGAIRLMRAGEYTIPGSSVAALDEWRYQADQVAQFVAERLRPSPHLTTAEAPRSGTAASELYQDYSRDWCEDTGHRQLSMMRFCQRLQSLGFQPWRTAAARVYPLAFNPKGAAAWKWGAEVGGAMAQVTP